jgi:ATP-binding cassette, subfamily C, bacteriocin exporter
VALVPALFARYHCVRQLGLDDCGAAALATVALHLGVRTSLQSVRELTRLHGDSPGTSLLALVRAGEALGLSAQGVLAEQEALQSLACPLIAHTHEGIGDHYVVVFRISRAHLWVGDPRNGDVRKMARSDFARVWTGHLLLITASRPLGRRPNRWRHLSSPLGRAWRPLCAAFVVAALVVPLGLAPVFYGKILLDHLVPRGTTSAIIAVTAGCLLLVILRSVLDVLRQRLVARCNQRISFALQSAFVDRLLHLPMSFFFKTQLGGLLSRFNETTIVRSALTDVSLNLAVDLLFLAIVLAVFAYYDTRALLLILPFVPFLFIWTRLFAGRLRAAHREIADTSSHLGATLADSLHGVAIVKAFAAESAMRGKLDAGIERMQAALARATSTAGAFAAGVSGFTGVAYTCFALAGALLLASNRLSVGELATLLVLVGLLFGPIERVARSVGLLQDGMVALERYGEILDAAPEQLSSSTVCTSTLGEIVIEDLTFSYGDGRHALRDVCLTIPAGASVGVVGPSGSGKTTLLSLLMRNLKPNAGRILIDGVDLQDRDLAHYRHQVAIVPQDYQLLDGTVRENLLLGRPDASSAELLEAATMVGAEAFIRRLPRGFDTPLGEHGARLSGGERQRLALARAILRRPNVLLLDEPTSALDSLTEAALLKAMQELPPTTTVFIASHRISAVWSCDLLCVFDDGSLIEMGTRDQLLGSNGLFVRFLQQQFPASPTSGKRARPSVSVASDAL